MPSATSPHVRVSILVLLDYGALRPSLLANDDFFHFVSILVLLDYGALR